MFIIKRNAVPKLKCNKNTKKCSTLGVKLFNDDIVLVKYFNRFHCIGTYPL